MKPKQVSPHIRASEATLKALASYPLTVEYDAVTHRFVVHDAATGNILHESRYEAATAFVRGFLAGQQRGFLAGQQRGGR